MCPGINILLKYKSDLSNFDYHDYQLSICSLVLSVDLFVLHSF